MAILAKENKVRNILVDHRKGYLTTEAAIAEIVETLYIPVTAAKPNIFDIEFGTVFTARNGGKCVAMSEPDKDGRFWMFSANGSKMVQYVSNVMKVHKKESKRMRRVISDMPDNPAAWYNQPIFTGYDE